MQEFTQESKIPHMGVRVKGSEKCKQESAQKSKVFQVWMKIHEGVKGSQNCKWEFAWESKVLRLGVRVCMGVQGLGFSGESLYGGPRSTIMGMAMKVRTRVKGFRKCKREFMWEFRVLHVGAKVCIWVKGSWNCKHETMRESRFLGVGAKVHTEVQGLKHGGESLHESLKVSKVGAKIHGGSKGYGITGESPHESPWSWEWEQEIAQRSKGPRIIRRNMCRSWRVLKLQAKIYMGAEGHRNGGDNPHKGRSNNLGYDFYCNW
jgi:hypothetical protein